jgi:hypothetical protein
MCKKGLALPTKHGFNPPPPPPPPPPELAFQFTYSSIVISAFTGPAVPREGYTQVLQGLRNVVKNLQKLQQ